MDDEIRILVLGEEDNPGDLIEYELSKSNLRFKALCVTSREAFLQALQESAPNLILITSEHPEIGGSTALALAQEFCPATPCFFISPIGGQKRAPARQGAQVDDPGRGIFGVHLETSIATFFAATGITPLIWDKSEAPHQTQAALQPFLQVDGVIIAFLSPDGRILECNRGAEHLTGWGRHEILGQNGIGLFFPETHRTSATDHLQQILSGKSAESIDLPLIVRQGLALSYRWYWNLVSDRLGQPAGIMLVGQLLSESKLGDRLARVRLARTRPSPATRKGQGLLTRRTGSC